jgi:hypothetical protein
MTTQTIRMLIAEIDEDLVAVIWFAILGLSLSFACMHTFGFDPSAWM